MVELVVSEGRARASLQHRQTLESVANAIRSHCAWFHEHHLLVATTRHGCYFFLNFLKPKELVLWLDLPCEHQALYRYGSSGWRRLLALHEVVCPPLTDLTGSGCSVQVPSVYVPHRGATYPIVQWARLHYVVLAARDDEELSQFLEQYQYGNVVPLPAGARCVHRRSEIVVDFRIGGLRARALFWVPDPALPHHDATVRHRALNGRYRFSLPILRQQLGAHHRWLELIERHGWFPLLVTDRQTKLVPTVLRCAGEAHAFRRTELGHYLTQQMESLWRESRTRSGERWGDLCARSDLNVEFKIDPHVIRALLGDPVLLERARVHRIFWLPIDLAGMPRYRLQYGPVAVDCTVDGQRMVVAPLPLQHLLALPYLLSTTLENLS